MVAVGQQRQAQHQKYRRQSAAQNIGSAPAQPAAAPIGQASEQRQQKQRQHIIRRHNGTGEGLVQMEGIGQNQGHQIVVHLPEGTDGQEGKASQNRAAGVQFHM